MHVRTYCHHRRRPGGRAGGPEPARRRLPRAHSPWWATRPIRPISARLCPRPICWAHLRANGCSSKADDFYREAGCELLLNTQRHGDPPRGKDRGRSATGAALSYDKLLLATGTRVRKLKCPGADLPGMHYLRDIADVDGLQDAFKPGTRIAIVGGGYIGLEVAAVAAKRGLDVTVFEAHGPADGRALSPSRCRISIAAEHEKAGVRLKLRHRRRRLRRQGKVEARARGRQSLIPPIWCWWASAWCPMTNSPPPPVLAAATALWWTSNAMTGDPAIFAAGDCTRHHRPRRHGDPAGMRAERHRPGQACGAGDGGQAQDL